VTNKFEKLARLVGFIIRIYHDARSPERQKTLQLPPRAFRWISVRDCAIHEQCKISKLNTKKKTFKEASMGIKKSIRMALKNEHKISK